MEVVTRQRDGKGDDMSKGLAKLEGRRMRLSNNRPCCCPLHYYQLSPTFAPGCALLLLSSRGSGFWLNPKVGNTPVGEESGGVTIGRARVLR